MAGFWDWAGRVVMLVLAGMITLSIIGAIAAIPSESLPHEMRFGRPTQPMPAPVEQVIPPETRPQELPGAAAPAASGKMPQPVDVAPAAKPAANAADWLEAITYSLFALIGLAALAILLLWRALGHWRRIADALESLGRPRAAR